MSAQRQLPTLILTAHGSADPRSSATTRAVAERIRLLRPGLDVRVAFCEKSTPNLRDVLAGLRGPAVVTPLLLASAFHARVDLPDADGVSEVVDMLLRPVLVHDLRRVAFLVFSRQPTREGLAELRRLYAEENRSDERVDYGDGFRFSMNQGDYARPEVE